MADTVAKMRTWACPNCEYKQFHDPSNEAEMNSIFREPVFQGRPLGACPACYSGRNAQRTAQLSMLGEISGVDLSALGERRVADDSTLESTTVIEVDQYGREVQEQVGETETLAIVEGKPAVVTAPVYEPKMRSLTDEELAALKEQRDQNLDALEKVAVKEITQTKEELK